MVLLGGCSKWRLQDLGAGVERGRVGRVRELGCVLGGEGPEEVEQARQRAEAEEADPHLRPAPVPVRLDRRRHDPPGEGLVGGQGLPEEVLKEAGVPHRRP